MSSVQGEEAVHKRPPVAVSYPPVVRIMRDSTTSCEQQDDTNSQQLIMGYGVLVEAKRYNFLFFSNYFRLVFCFLCLFISTSKTEGRLERKRNGA